ncbi:DUF2259 domain-containing protein [Mesorhizobium sp. B292B1B]|uniref:DUF2259 domain-containing protein n=1 Tax=Mesorhizobium sp. B2-3-2 TaxID=2589961 RepID=UPI0011284DDE|nr:MULTISPECIES: DUF2259 domain-containing protein [unclassified Mesorhizobium]MBZ9963064.1 DUF2259 domain-containing protein [Mesorhizobium sp. BR1-1-2]MCA0013468.1 DUF2259 domain-containing protein [Mesorhizobium sp. B294B1A1]MCA0037524.1 DUF2259 domain-containing protein [Mesorhizobium sp. B292B1B]TPM50639.1 DUF2259 domain-containing protein [Mesorhizobium sp. B2-3-2]
MQNRLLFAVCLLAQFCALVAARAGDVAELEILGFTKDGGVFAFEEYGVQDGSGFPCGNRYSLSAYAVLIAVRQYGFEGPDYRWIAVTGHL